MPARIRLQKFKSIFEQSDDHKTYFWYCKSCKSRAKSLGFKTFSAVIQFIGSLFSFSALAQLRFYAFMHITLNYLHSFNGTDKFVASTNKQLNC